MNQIEPPLTDTERDGIRNEVVNYLQNTRKTLQTISDLYLDYSTALANLDAKESSFIQIVQEYKDFIDKNILWVKSSSSLSIKDIPGVITAVRWLTYPEHWQQVAEVFITDIRKKPLPYIAIIAFFALLVVLHRRMHKSIEDLYQKLQDASTDSFMDTLKVFVLTLFLAATWPVIILFMRWRLSVNASGYDFTQAFAGGLRDLSIGIFIFELLRHMTMPGGLIQNHFRVGAESLAFARKNMRWFFVLVIPLTFVVRILQLQHTDDQMYNSMGRLVFIANLILLSIFL